MIRKKKTTSYLFDQIILFFNSLFASLLILSYFAPIINPRWLWPIPFLGLAYPIFLLFNIFFMGYWLFYQTRFALISFFAIAIGWNFIGSYIGFRPSTTIGTPKSSKELIRIMTYNVHEFKQFGEKNDKKTRDLFLSIIRDEQPDIICFQEFFTREKEEYNFKKSISAILHTSHYYYNPTKGNGYETIGLAIFSKYPIINTGLIRFEKHNNNESIFADIQVQDRVFRVYNVHLQSIRFKPEDYEYLDEVKKQMDADIRSSYRIVHLLNRAFIKRSRQIKLLRAHTKSCNTPYFIAGDFNDTPISYAVNRMLSVGLINSFREKGSGFGVTYNGDFPNFQIDYILATPDFSVKNHRIIKKKASDHYAVRSDLELN